MGNFSSDIVSFIRGTTSCRPIEDLMWATVMGSVKMNKYPVFLMVTSRVIWNVVIPPYFFAKGERLTGSDSHCEYLWPFCENKGNALFDHNSWVFQKDGSSFHPDWIGQEWCRNNLSFWILKQAGLLNSSELTPSDYYLVQTRIYAQIQHKNATTMKIHVEIEKATKLIDVRCVRDMIDAFLRRYRSVKKRGAGLVFCEYT